ncbi:TPA: hypothetical protein N0F65_004513 [Lagenidium giganteum]|uniref:Calcineurin-like phosphoesterase domain-containing protein n=1 Tax=Lagenidium giganteum TaxID=4803 RepID=A0AAV2YXA1_9STRA|nr:TPA: hypothetical protein N0F65_004513 [Lagenidium giganteum]
MMQRAHENVALPERLHVTLEVPADTRVVVVGDVHGCLDELKDVLALCEFDASKDRLVLVGDLVNKGPNSCLFVNASLQVLRFVREVGAVSVRGNHDDAVLNAFYQWKQGGSAAISDKYAYVQQLTDDDVRLLEALPFTITLPHQNAIVVHAGLVPDVPLEEQSPFNMYKMRHLLRNSANKWDVFEKKPSPDSPAQQWATLWPGPIHVYFGHDAKAGLQREEHATGLDTGCCYGRQLTACILPDRKLVSVPARAAAFSHFHRASKKTMRQQPRHTPQRALLSGELKLEPRPEASLDKGSSASARHVAAMRKPSTGASSFKAKMDAMLRMMQSTTIVQTYTKLLQQMHAVPRLVIDGVEQEMVAVTAGDPAPSSGAFSNQLLHSVGQAGRKDARARRTAFHYGHSFRFRPAHTSMSLKEIKHLDVMICSAVCTPTRISPSALQASSWRLVAKSDDRVGLALYELDLGQWRGSALVALVWESTLEIEWLFVQSNVAELLYNIPRRPIKILPDDVDPLYGLHSYTASITLRSLDNVLWEKEFYQVRFQNDQLISSSNSKQSSLRSAVVATLLDNTARSSY